MAGTDFSQVYLDAARTTDEVMAAAFGPRWLRMAPDFRAELTAAAWLQWATTDGIREGLVALGQPRLDRKTGRTRPGSIELRTADMTILARSFASAARRMAEQVHGQPPSETGEQAEFEDALLTRPVEADTPPPAAGADALTRAAFGSRKTPDQLQLEAPDAYRPDRKYTTQIEEEEREAILVRLTQALAALETATGPAEQARSLLIRLHLGQRVIPGAPPELYSKRVYSRATRAFYVPKDRKTGRPKESAFDDFLRYHSLGRAKSAASPCPSCGRLARFVRVPGLTVALMAQIIDDFVVQTRTR